MAFDKVRIRFRKAGDLRLVSHHDLMRCWERMLRRAAIPFHCTGGFNPKPRLVFALSLGLGIVGSQEVVELELDQPIPAEELAVRLRAQAPIGLEILSVRPIPPKTTAHVCRVTYRIAVPAEAIPGLAERIAPFLAQAEAWIDRIRPQPRRLNIRPYVASIRLLANSLEMDLWVTPNGTVRPDEVLTALGLAHLLHEGGVLERAAIELEDEVPPADRPPALTQPAAAATEIELQTAGPGGRQPAAGAGPHPLLPGPLDY